MFIALVGSLKDLHSNAEVLNICRKVVLQVIVPHIENLLNK